MSTRLIEPTTRCNHSMVIKFDQIEKENTVDGKKTPSRYKKKHSGLKKHR